MKYFSVLMMTVMLTTICLAKEPEKNIEKATVADYGISGDAQLLTNFIYKGLSYSDNNPAMNASFMANLGSQVKLGVWGSNVSNLSAPDDNLWLKIIAKVDIVLGDKFMVNVFLYDSHFYKSSQRNGFNLGADFNYKQIEFGLEWMSNFEGTKGGAEYFWAGKLYDYKKNMKVGGYAGISYSNTSAIQSYLDFKILGQYILTPKANTEVGLTFNSNSSQFGIRDDPAVYAAVKLSY